MNQLIISNLSKTYPSGLKALDNISLNISQGMFGLLGPNGAGKSTLMRIVASLQEPDSGSLKFNEIDILLNPNELKRNLGFLPQQFGLYPKITAEVLLDHLAILKGLSNKENRKERVEALLHKTNLYQHRKQKLGGFSGGMKQRFGVAQALLNDPKLLLVDEPTAGLDPAERNRFYNILSELSENTIVILSSHIVDDIKELCTRMAIINAGQVLVTGEPLKLIKELEGKVYQKKIEKSELKLYQNEYRLLSSKLFLGELIINILSDSHPQNGFSVSSANLEDVYFSHINAFSSK